MEIVECVTPAQRREFIEFQWEIYKGNPYWVPPLLSDRDSFYNPDKNLFFKHSAAAMFMAREGERILGTIAAAHNTRHLEKWRDGVGFFGAFECVNDVAVATALFAKAGAWLKARGLSVMRGPATLSLNDECGLLIEGFDGEPQVLMTYNPPYYAALVEAQGFKKSMDLLAWWADLKEIQPLVEGRFFRVANLVQKRGKFTLRTINLKDIDKEFAAIKGVLYSGPWEANWGHVTPREDEMNHLIHQLAQFVDPELVIVAEIEGKAVGIGAVLPNVNHALRAAYPKPGTPEFWTLLKFLAFSKTRLFPKNAVDTARFVVLGVLPEHRMSGIDAVILKKCTKP